MIYYHLTAQSTNKKTGPIPVSTTARGTCPDACPLKSGGCYADDYHLSMHWDKVTAGNPRGINLAEFSAKIAALPEGQLWRHNQAGDLPGLGDHVDVDALDQLVTANTGKRGFTYTHKPLAAQRERDAIADANRRGFTVNLSANNPEHADRLADLDIAPVATILPSDQLTNTTTPAGRPIVICPAISRDGVTCKTCKLCSKTNRPIIGFPAHGTKAKAASAIASQA